jgi:hypothetical protein
MLNCSVVKFKTEFIIFEAVLRHALRRQIHLLNNGIKKRRQRGMFAYNTSLEVTTDRQLFDTSILSLCSMLQ